VGLGDWAGLGRDTALILGYQVVGVGIFYLLPEGVSQWSVKEKENASWSSWWDNVQHPTWDRDQWWINAGHAYFGAAYYIRARERGFGELPSFAVSALWSAMFVLLGFAGGAVTHNPLTGALLALLVALVLGALLSRVATSRTPG